MTGLGQEKRVVVSRLALAAALGAVVLLGHPGEAGGVESEVDASLSAQWYSLTSPAGDPTLRRRRYVHTLGLTVRELLDRSTPEDPDLVVRARLRVDADLGQEGPERDPDRPDRFVPGLEQAPLDVMYAYVEGRGLVGGLFGFRAGRQYVVDPIGWWSFDGGLLRLETPAYLAAEVYGGYEQRAALPLGTQRFEAGGVWRGDREGFGLDLHPSFLGERRLAPAFGGSLGTAGLQFVHAKVAYRKVWTRDVVLVSPFPDLGGGFERVGGARTSSEKVALGAGANYPKVGALETQGTYDFVVQRPSEWALGADAFVTERVTAGARLEHYYPTFDGDSIWNWFSHQGMTTGLLRAAFEPSRALALAASGGLRWYRTEGDPASDADRTNRDVRARTDALGSADARYRFADGSIGVRATFERGQRGHRHGGDVTLRRTFDGGLWDTLAVVSLHDWSDALRPQRDATSFQYVLGGGISPLTATRFGLEWEHATNRLVGQRFRALATLDVVVPP